ncbi:hypothetical protein V1506DRAFT_531074 [Lipomyces tetrasporus]
MAVNLGTLGITAASVAIVTAMYFLHIGHPKFYRRRLKSSAIFVKSLYTTESLLSDALRTKYKVFIDGDGLVSAISYENSPYIQSFVIPRTPGQKRWSAIIGSAIFLVLYTLFGLVVIISYGAGDSSFIIATVGMIFSISCIFLGIYLLKSSFKNEAGGVTVYFNATEENWVTSSDLALFNSSDRIEVAIKWPSELFSQILNAWLHVCGSGLSIILNEGRRKRNNGMVTIIFSAIAKKKKPGMVTIILSAISCCAQIVSVMQPAKFVWWMRRTVPVVEVQFAQAVSEKDADADILQFDVGKVATKFAHDIVKEFGKNWTASAGVYTDFALAGEHGGLVYGRIRAGGLPANV